MSYDPDRGDAPSCVWNWLDVLIWGLFILAGVLVLAANPPLITVTIPPR